MMMVGLDVEIDYSLRKLFIGLANAAVNAL
jgi:hypothetical protein